MDNGIYLETDLLNLKHLPLQIVAILIIIVR